MVTHNKFTPKVTGIRKKKPFGVAISCEQRLMVIDLALTLSVNSN
jgi:hypothetical protein